MFKLELNPERDRLKKASENQKKGVVFESAMDGLKQAKAKHRQELAQEAGGLNYEQYKENTIGRVLEQIKQIKDHRAKKEFIDQHASHHAHTRKDLHDGKQTHEKPAKHVVALKDLEAAEKQKIEAAYRKLQILLHPDNIKDTMPNAAQRRKDRERTLHDITIMKDKNIARFKDIAKHFKIDIDSKN